MGSKKNKGEALAENRPIPLGQRVLVQQRVEKKEKKSTSGIIIPEGAKVTDQPENVGKIIQLSPHLTEEWTSVLQKGDEIIYSKVNNDEVKIAGLVYLLIPTENILGKLPS